jgi:chromosome segregation ATPase
VTGRSDAVAHVSARAQTTVQRQRDEPKIFRQRNDWASSVSAVQEAGKALRSSEQRTTQMAARAEAALQLAAEELDAAHKRISDCEDQLRLAELRANRAEALLQQATTLASEAEARARQAEEWLDRIHQAIRAEFPQK